MVVKAASLAERKGPRESASRGMLNGSGSRDSSSSRRQEGLGAWLELGRE